MALLDVQNLSVTFALPNSTVHAVQDLSFSVERREIIGVVGESGCGKSTLCMSLVKLLPRQTCTVQARALQFNGTDILATRGAALRALRGSAIALVFQDPAAALNPYLRVVDQVAEPLRIHQRIPRAQAHAQALTAMRNAGIPNPNPRAYPHELSGGMRQRAMIAMALITGPQLLLADEPTTGLDVTIQARILARLKHLQARNDMSIVLVTHDLGVVAGMCQRVMIMYAGKIVESGTTEAIFYQTAHPYTRALINALPSAQNPARPLESIGGFPPDLSVPIPGCPFAPRCAFAIPRCSQEPITLTPIAAEHCSACGRITRRELCL